MEERRELELEQVKWAIRETSVSIDVLIFEHKVSHRRICFISALFSSAFAGVQLELTRNRVVLQMAAERHEELHAQVEEAKKTLQMI